MALKFAPERGVTLPEGTKTLFKPTTIDIGYAVIAPDVISTMRVAIDSIRRHPGSGTNNKYAPPEFLSQLGYTYSLRRNRHEMDAVLTVNDDNVIFSRIGARRGHTWTMPNYLIGLRGGLDVAYNIDGTEYPGKLIVVDNS